MSLTHDALAGLSPQEKRELLAKLLREREAAPEAHPLSPGQRALWFFYRLAPESPVYNVFSAARLRRPAQAGALGKALQALVDRHVTLRTTYASERGEPVQRVHRTWPARLETVDARGWGRDALRARIEAEADRPFALEEAPALRAILFAGAPGGDVLLFVFHHIAVDFWSLDILGAELEHLYAAALAGEPPTLPPPAGQFTDYLRWQAQALAGPEGERSWSWWRERLADVPPLEIPLDHPRPPVQGYRGVSFAAAVDEGLTRSLRVLAAARGATLFTVLLAAYQVLLARYGGQDDVAVGSPMAGRDRPELQGIVGYLINPVVLRGDLSGDPTFAAFLARLNPVVVGAIEHQEFPFPLVVERLRPQRDPSRSPLFQAAFFWDRRLRGGGGMDPYASGQRGAPVDLTLTVVVGEASLEIVWLYNPELFEAATIARMARHFRTLLEGIAARPEERVSRLPLLPPDEERRLVEAPAGAGEDAPYEDAHRRVEAQAARAPDAVAVVAGEVRLTYGELDRGANRLARRLRALGVGPESVVAIRMERTAALPVAVLAVLKAGGAYLPLDPAHPRARAEFMLRDAGAAVLLTDEALRDGVDAGAARVLVLDADGGFAGDEANGALDAAAGAESLAYVIYTSGSTGTPKGVQVPRGALDRFLRAVQRTPGMGRDDVVLALTTLAFDISLLELLLPLTVGARVVVAPREVAANGERLAEVLREHGATVMQATPSGWRLLLEAGWRGSPTLTALCGGEALPWALAERLLPRVGALWNLYGPTEATVWCAAHRVQARRGATVPLGAALDGVRLHLLDGTMRPVPPGVCGELYVGGRFVARGYAGAAALTAARFVPDLFAAEPGARLFRTGDGARRLADGTLEFLGRIDQQVKVSGYRIEPGEIEAVLAAHPEVRAAVVTVRDDPHGERRLVGYAAAANGRVPTAGELRRFLKARLPDYMVPAVYVPVDAVPLTPSGKVDRRALPAPTWDRPELETGFEPPREGPESLLAALWVEVLGVSKVGAHDNFFDLGGASIQTLRVAERAREAGLSLTPEMVFQHQTVRELAEALDTAGDAGAAEEDIATGDLDALETEGFPVLETPAPETALAAGNTVIESLGVYLPPRVVSTDEVLRGCRKRMLFPLERMTGIRARRMAGDGEFSIDLAARAVQACLARSRWHPADIDLLICCNISRYDAAGRFSFEPSTAVVLRGRFGLGNALAFDVGNACTGVFTAINLADAWLRSGAVRRAMVVSGEYISHLTDTAQREIDGFMDPRLACLTLGDAGMAVVLERSADPGVGFHQIDLYTLGRYAGLCIAKVTDRGHGGAIMLTDAIRQTAVGVGNAVAHAAYMLRRGGWGPEAFDHLVMHQTSETALRDAMRAINKLYRRKVCHDDNTVMNLRERGNTATTTHWVALADRIAEGRVRKGDRVLFGISGSGQTIGTALYTFDDLPERLRGSGPEAPPAPRSPAPRTIPTPRRRTSRVRVESVGLPPAAPKDRTALGMAGAAAEDCLARSAYGKGEVELLLYAGVYRDEFLSEPAMAAMLAGQLEMNHDVRSPEGAKTLALDVFNGGVGFLNACWAASESILGGKFRTAMVAVAEVENNRGVRPDHLLGVRETGSAVLLDEDPRGESGFGGFVFRYRAEGVDAYRTASRFQDGVTYLAHERAPDLHERYLALIEETVRELLWVEGVDAGRLRAVFPPQISPAFTAALAARLGIPIDRFVQVPGEGDLFTSSLPHALRQARDVGRMAAGDVGLLIAVGSGVQAGCALYHF